MQLFITIIPPPHLCTHPHPHPHACAHRPRHNWCWHTGWHACVRAHAHMLTHFHHTHTHVFMKYTHNFITHTHTHTHSYDIFSHLYSTHIHTHACKHAHVRARTCTHTFSWHIFTSSLHTHIFMTFSHLHYTHTRTHIAFDLTVFLSFRRSKSPGKRPPEELKQHFEWVPLCQCQRPLVLRSFAPYRQPQAHCAYCIELYLQRVQRGLVACWLLQS